MKTVKCDLCEVTAQGETFEEWMKALMPHYMEAHIDFMKQQGQKPKEEQMEEMKKWIADNKARFDSA